MPRRREGESAYSEKLRDPRWQKLRLQVFERDAWKCCHCDDATEMLAVHHKRYVNGREPWEYPLDELMTLCEDCHQNEYEYRRKEEQTLLEALRLKGFLYSDLNALMSSVMDLGGSLPPLIDRLEGVPRSKGFKVIARE